MCLLFQQWKAVQRQEYPGDKWGSQYNQKVKLQFKW